MLKNNIFGIFLTLTAALMSLVLGWELFLQTNFPGDSSLTRLHSLGFLTEIPAASVPNKGVWHLIGWAGSLFMVVMLLYSIRKRVRFFYSFGNLYTWLNIHIFLGVIGPVLVTFHTTFKLGGLVSVSFWCMLLVSGSGVLGRYIFLKIPRGLSGHELEIEQIETLIGQMETKLRGLSVNQELINGFIRSISPVKPDGEVNPFKTLLSLVKKDFGNLKKIRLFKRQLRMLPGIKKGETREVLQMVRRKARLIRGMNFLATNQKLLNYWHIFHIPLTIILFFVMFLHIGVYFLFRA